METVETIKKKLQRIEQDRSKVITEIDVYDEIYHLEAAKVIPPGWDEHDIVHVVSPSGANKVNGIAHLLSATEPIIKINAKSANLMERKLKSMLAESNKFVGAKLEQDMAISAALHSEIHVVAKDISLILKDSNLKPIQRMRYERLFKKTPYIFSVVNSKQVMADYSANGDLIMWFEKYVAYGDILKIEYGNPANPLQDDKEYTIYDGYTLENRLIYVEEDDLTLKFGKHNLSELPVCSIMVNGNSLFHDPDKKRKPFLYNYWKSGLYESENILLSAMLTHTKATGFGPVLIGKKNPASSEDFAISIDNQGPIRTIFAEGGEVMPSQMQAYSRELPEAQALIKSLTDESTMYSQALGQPVQGNQAFSTVALLSQAGRLPITPIQKGVEAALEGIFSYILNDIKENNQCPLFLASSDISEEFMISVTMDVNLSQDAFREAQIASQLRGLVTDEMIRQDILHLTDNDSMVEKIWTEQADNELFKAMLPGLIQEFQGSLQKMRGGAAPAPEQGAPGPQQGQPNPSGVNVDGNTLKSMLAANPQIAQNVGMRTPNSAMAGGGALEQVVPNQNTMNGL